MQRIELAPEQDAAFWQWVALTTLEVENETQLYQTAGCSPEMIRAVLRHGGN